MAITPEDVIGHVLTNDEVFQCISNAQSLLKNMGDRDDLHSRSCLERFNDIVMGEIAEQSVIKWIKSHGKFAESAVDKASGCPDRGHDIILHAKDKRTIKCSVKSSLSAFKNKMPDILETFRLSSKPSEVQDVNIQVYFWLDLDTTPRISTPSDTNMVIIGWLGSKDLSEDSGGQYATEARPVVGKYLKEMRSMHSLLNNLI